MSLPLFDREDDLPAQAARLGPMLRAQAERGIYWGTSSWKYEGWLGTIYSPDRYRTRGKFSRKKFEQECLAEYARTFPVVCGDFAFYQFPSPDYWRRLFGETPDSLAFAFKVPEDITVARWPTHARYGVRAGRDNDAFLDPKLFQTLFAERLRPHAARVACLIFEFGTFARATFATPVDFFARLDPFLAALPGGFRYAIEIRNPEYLGTDYFGLLASRNTAHVFNAWTRMPALDVQAAMEEAYTADFTVARALLARHRSYEDAVRSFEPYESIRQPSPETRQALGRLAAGAIRRKRPAFLFVNNRLEGNAPSTIEAVVESLGP